MYSPIPEISTDIKQEEEGQHGQGENSESSIRRAKVESPISSAAAVLLQWEWRIFLGFFFVGCLIFGAYTVLFYWRTMFQLNPRAWDVTLPGLYHPDRRDSNAAIGLHLLGAGYLMLLGPLQYFKAIRRRAMSFHRWNGRISLVLLVVTAIGGIYYVWAVGLTAAPLIGQRLNNQNYLFGISVLTCAVGIYHHAVRTKDIARHKRWAYRLAGIMFGNIYARLYFTLVYLLMGEDRFPKVMRKAGMVLVYTFFIPFIFLADWIWVLEQRRLDREADGDILPDKSSSSSAPSPWKIAWAVVSSLLLLTFVTSLAVQSSVFWIPFCFIDLNATESSVESSPLNQHQLGE